MQEYIYAEPGLLLKAYSTPYTVTAHLYAKKALGYSDILDANLGFQQLKWEQRQTKSKLHVIGTVHLMSSVPSPLGVVTHIEFMQGGCLLLSYPWGLNFFYA